MYIPLILLIMRNLALVGAVQRFPLHFLMRVNQAFLDAVDDWRRTQPDIPPRAEAIRRLVSQALDQPERKEGG
jgi:hypothetical protein